MQTSAPHARRACFRAAELGSVLAAQDSRATSGNYGLLDQLEACGGYGVTLPRSEATKRTSPSSASRPGPAVSACICFRRRVLSCFIARPCSLHRVPLTTCPLTPEPKHKELICRTRSAAPAPTTPCAPAFVRRPLARCSAHYRNIVFGPGVAWGPTVDGVTITAQPLELLNAGKTADVPIIVGANEDEGSLFFSKATIETEADLREAIGELFAPLVVDAAIAHYGLSPSASYLFSRTFYDFLISLGAFHGAEMPFVFDNPLRGLSTTGAGKRLTTSIQGYWTSLATRCDPNGGTRANWPRYEKAGDHVLRLDVPISEETNLRSADCDFWDSQR